MKNSYKIVQYADDLYVVQFIFPDDFPSPPVGITSCPVNKSGLWYSYGDVQDLPTFYSTEAKAQAALDVFAEDVDLYILNCKNPTAGTTFRFV